MLELLATILVLVEAVAVLAVALLRYQDHRDDAWGQGWTVAEEQPLTPWGRSRP